MKANSATKNPYTPPNKEGFRTKPPNTHRKHTITQKPFKNPTLKTQNTLRTHYDIGQFQKTPAKLAQEDEHRVGKSLGKKGKNARLIYIFFSSTEVFFLKNFFVDDGKKRNDLLLEKQKENNRARFHGTVPRKTQFGKKTMYCGGGKCGFGATRDEEYNGTIVFPLCPRIWQIQ